jgi:hypothetical protein
LSASLTASVAVNGWSFGPVEWIGMLALTGLALVFTLPYDANRSQNNAARCQRHRDRSQECTLLLGRKSERNGIIPHELKHLPVKRGTATVNIKFDGIKHIDVKANGDKTPSVLHITLSNGKTGGSRWPSTAISKGVPILVR